MSIWQYLSQHLRLLFGNPMGYFYTIIAIVLILGAWLDGGK